MVREILNDANQAVNAPPLDDPDADEDDVLNDGAVPALIEYRGGHASVTVDDFNLVFGATERANRRVHKPLPVATEADVKAGDAPRNAVVLPVAVELVRTNPLFGFGVACEYTDDDGEVCGDVFQTIKSLDGHQSSHGGGDDGADADADNGGES